MRKGGNTCTNLYHCCSNSCPYLCISEIPKAITINDMYPDKRFARLTNLKAGASIQFRVKAVNNYGIGAPSLPTG